MFDFRRKYKVDEWSNFVRNEYVSAYYRNWWWPFWLRCFSGTTGMCTSVEQAKAQCLQHKNRINVIPVYLDI